MALPVESEGTSRFAHSRSIPIAIAAAAYIVLSVFAFWQSWHGGITHTMTCGCFDPGQSAWFLEWTSFALVHGHNPFLSAYLNVPHGVNLMDNAAMPLLGTIMTPVTYAFGPVVSWNVLAMLAMSGSALVAFCVFRRYAPWWPAAFTGGLIFGFGPYLATQGPNHLNLSFMVFPPLALWFLDAIVLRQKGNPLKWGLGLGLCCAAQVLVSTEILATTAMIAVIGIVCFAVFSTAAMIGDLGARLVWAAKSVACAAATFAIAAGYPLWVSFSGPDKIVGQEATNTTFLSANLLGFVIPSSNQLITVHGTHTMVDPYFVGGFLAENTTYVGITLLVALVATTIWLRSEVIIKVAAICLSAAAVLSLGSRLFIGTHKFVAFTLPYSWIAHLPMMSNVIPARFAVFVDLFAGLIIAIGIDKLRLRRIVAAAAHSNTERRAAVLPIVAALVVLLPILPAWPYSMQDTSVPNYFTSSAVKAIAPGTIADVYPFPRVTQGQAMLYQAESAMRFKMLGGFMLIPNAKGMGTEFNLPPGVTEIWFGSAYWLHGPFTVVPSAVTGVREELRRQNVGSVIIADVGDDPQGARALIAASLGVSVQLHGGVWVWNGVQKMLDAVGQPR